MKKINVFYATILGLIGFFAGQSVYAVCPVCTIAVGAGGGLARYLGVDDTVTGTWVGGLMISLILWTLNWFEKKNIIFKGREVITILLYYGLVVVPLVWIDVIGHPLNKLWGFDKLLLGITAGSIVFILANFLYELIKRKNGGRAWFPFQKIVMPVLALIITSGVFYLITK